MNTLTELGERIIKAEEQRDQFKAERDTLEDDVLAWAVTCKSLEQENKKLKEEQDKFEKMLNEECERGYQMEGKYHDMKTERDTLIDDLSWYKAKVSRLEQIRDIKDSALKGADIKIKTLEREKEKLRKANSNGWKQKDEVINKLISNIKSKDNLLSEFSQHIGNKPSSSTYKYFRAKLDGIGIEEGE